jgi:hypothetical protein
MIFEKTDHVTYVMDLLARPSLGFLGRRQLQQNQIGHRRELK